MPKAGSGFAQLTCWVNNRPAVRELCWEMLAALSERKQQFPARDPTAKWTLDIAERPVALSDDCYWMGPMNIFCRQGQLSWDYTSDSDRAGAFAAWSLKRVHAEADAAGSSGTVVGAGPCRILGIATRCVRGHTEWKLGERTQIVDAIYGYVPVGANAMSVVCSVDRATVPEGIGPLCSQLIQLD